ncbi:MAG: transcription antitermination protein NusB [Bacteroidales bacterium]|jgi:N utilization substance protein B|nr:transcription antitermination protein NusB [Bacteroidales bacterium]
MLNRRIIRVKVFKELFSRIATGSDSYKDAEKELMASCEKTRDLYLYLLKLPIALKTYAEKKIENGLKKYMPTEEEKNPNRKFVDNGFIKVMEEDASFFEICGKKKLEWNDYGPFIKNLYDRIAESDYFKAYMSSPEPEDSSAAMKEDIKLMRCIYSNHIDTDKDLEDIIEDGSLLWVDDIGYVCNVIISNLKSIAKRRKVVIPPLFKSSAASDVPQDAKNFEIEDDERFARKLLTSSMLHYDEYTEIISSFVSNWNTERLVSTDLTLIVMGMTEAASFPTIPLKVTINEYVDISKYYSTPNSKVFVNGLLDKILQKMVEEKKIIKTGRGLIDN